MSDPAQFLKVVEELVFNFSTLVMVNGFWKPKSHDKVIIQFISSSLGGLITGGIRLGKSSVMVHDHQYILVSTRAWFKMNIIQRDKLEKRCRNDRLERRINVSRRFSLLQETTHYCDITGDVCSHEWSIETLSH